MNMSRPCGCKGCRTCLICETHYGAHPMKPTLNLDKSKGYVYCPFCNKAWTGWDVNLYKEHPNHQGESIDVPGILVQLDFISDEQEQCFMKNIDDMPWDVSQSGRRKQNFGPKTNFKKQKIVPGSFEGFPKFSQFIQDRFSNTKLLQNYGVIEQCSLEYDPTKGASIDPHIDDCWVWGERIVTVNCLSDSVLTLTPYTGDYMKYNLQCANQYKLVVCNDGTIDLSGEKTNQNALEASKQLHNSDVIIRIPMPRRSLILMYGEARYHWEHCVLREDITSRRVCIAYREFTPPYINGVHKDIGDLIRNKSTQFWDHRDKYNLIQ